jgi:lysophospholipid acyltransferase (LPLAT)-like uncharacterized protein
MQKLSFKYKLAVLLLNLLSKSWRIKLEGDFDYQGKGIIVFWHGFMLPVWKYFGKYKPVAVVSLSKDGEILSQLLEKWNFTLIRGSSSRKGKEVLEDIMNACKQKLLLITPDGPQGPIYKMKAGAVVAASRTHVPIYLCGVFIKKSKIFEKSWDKFRLPFPFTKIILRISKPIIIEKTDNKELIESKISELETNLLHLNT